MAVPNNWYQKLKSSSQKAEPHPVFPQGIQELYNPSNACVDIIFVHGLTGDRERTWTHQESSQSWPQQILPTLIPDARILTYGYDAYVLGYKGPAATNRIGDLARDFLNDLVGFRQQSKSLARPLIFVVHSLGGLVCKDALLLSRNSADIHLNDALNSTKAIAFMGTPHIGSALARWAKIPVTSLGVLKTSSTYLLSVLQTNSDVLGRIQSDFLELIRARAKGDKAVEITCFHELLSMPMVGKIVLRESAVLAGFNSISIHANHRDMVKFRSPADPGLRSLVGELSRWIDAVREVSSATTSETIPADIRQMNEEPSKLLAPTYMQYDSINKLERSSPALLSDNLSTDFKFSSTKLAPRLPEFTKTKVLPEALSKSIMPARFKDLSRPQSAVHNAFLRQMSQSENSQISSDSLDVRDQTEDLNSRGPLGLKMLYQPDEALIDFVFVHGLGGGSRKTWSCADPTINCWPQAFLPSDKDFKNCRIHSFGYNSDLGRVGAQNLSDISDFASALLGSLLYSPTLSKKPETPIVFVCHSMGGLIVKKAYLRAQQDQSYQSMAARIHAMVFLATPHRGSEYAAILNRLLATSIGSLPKQFISDMEHSSVALQEINEQFRHFAERLKLFSFYETRATGIGVRSSVVVEKSSAVLGYPNEVSLPLDANHYQMSKFASSDDPNYQSLRDVLATIVKDEGLMNTPRADLENIYNFLLLDEEALPQILQAHRGKVSTASLRWLVSSPVFQQWCDSDHDPNAQCLQLHAPPGAGKSFLAEQIVHYLRAQSFDVGYFFSDNHSNMVRCLKSIIYTLAKGNKEIGRRLKNLIFEDESFGPHNFHHIWDMIFVERIFKMNLSGPLYIIIDAIDEFKEASLLLSLLRSPAARSHLRLLLTCRTSPSPNIKALLRQTQLQIVPLEISPLAIASDAEVFISEKAAELKWMDGDMLDRTTSEILRRSSGCFRWVDHVFKGLQEIYTARGICELLESVPPDMAESYKTALDYATETCPEPRLLNSALAWAVYTNEPLTILQLQKMVEADLEERVFRLKEFLLSYCGDFLRIDSIDKVNFVHDTARTFLIDSAGLICLKGET